MYKREESYQRCRASIDELMLSASRHHHEVSSFDVLIFTSNSGFTDSGGEGQGLIDGVDLGEIAVSCCTREGLETARMNGPHLQCPHQQAQS